MELESMSLASKLEMLKKKFKVRRDLYRYLSRR